MIRVFATSDLHYGLDAQGDSATRSMVEYLKETTAENDLLCLAGDIGSDHETLGKCLELFAPIKAKKLALPGNHDVWTESQDSWKRYEAFAGLATKHGFHSLHEKPFLMNGTGVIGSMGWYDYSFLDLPDVDPSMAKAEIWGDALYVHWHWTDAGLTRHFGEKLQSDAERIMNCSEKIVVTHHLPTSKLLFHPRWLVRKRFRKANTFLGSNYYSYALSDCGPLDWVCGHSHMSRHARIGNLRFYSIGSDYQQKELMIKVDGRWTREVFT